MSQTFNEIERRVLGVLVEKSMAQPQYYPMTVNSIVAACNQKNNRDPEMNLDDEAVWSALLQLQQLGLVTRVLPPPGSRADRFKHDVPGKLGWQTPQRAIMTELMLRGPQTPGELRTNCGRMHEFASLEALGEALASLQNWNPPLVTVLPRAPGQAAVRYAHTLYPPDEQPPGAPAGDAAQASAGSAARGAGVHAAPPAPAAAVAASGASGPPAGDSGALTAQLEALQTEVAELHQRVSELESRLRELGG